jgi:hypothetical protein
VQDQRSRSFKKWQKKVKAAKAEVQRLLDAGFIREVKYPQWLANAVMVRKKMESGECAQT